MDGFLSRSELKALIVGIQFNEVSLDEHDAVEKVMKDFDTSLDSRVEFDEFVDGVGRWLQEASGNSIDDFHRVPCHFIQIF